MISRKTLKQIKALGIRIDHEQAFGGKSKGNKHLYRVVKIATYLAKKNNADVQITEAATWIHDTALPSGDDSSYEKNKKIAKKLLIGFELSKTDIDHIASAVASHEGTYPPQSLEAKIVHDADVLEKCGILGIIRHTWKLTNLNRLNTQHISAGDIQGIVKHIAWRKKLLHTTVAKKIHKNIDVKIPMSTLKSIVPIISDLASKSIITEKIAKRIIPYLSKAEQAVLESQLKVSYLK
jgi:hypothetical protein